MKVSVTSRIIGYSVVIAALIGVGIFGVDGFLTAKDSVDVVQMFPIDADTTTVQSRVVVPPHVLTPSGRKPKKRSPKRDELFEQQLRGLQSQEGAEISGEPGTTSSKDGPYVALVEDSSRTKGSTDTQNAAGKKLSSENSGGDATDRAQEDSADENPLGFLGGVMVSQDSQAPAVVTPDATPRTGRPWVRGQARGYTMLYAMQSEARSVVETQVETLLSAKIREPYIGVLIDGTFGRDFTYLKQVIERLSVDGRALTLALYLTNGPTMRKWRETPIDALFSKINPSDFRQRIRRDQTLQAQFLAVVLQAKDVFEFNVSLNPGNNNVAIVMLEDNLDSLAYRAMREIASAEIGAVAGFVRNPCLGCYEGNDDATLGDPREEHNLSRYNVLARGDGYSLDGTGFLYPDGSGSESGVTAAQLRDLMSNSFARGLRYFGLWQYQWQGLEVGGGNPRPSTRTYVPSNFDQQEFEVEILREGLVVEDEDDQEVGSEVAPVESQ